ncbi:hypothetical protein FA15DRAFT_670779 [Coprinopsis marcescibilis]|uniref:MI domain-containing protein n=1 Tax=Coprinopsis marcescibilis TaxID=230819 RepID=A0A5C3KRD5_COPMA|nr:hypothetical protein FA15DRAFT_670779 [Coprinopsis marcescibilis]
MSKSSTTSTNKTLPAKSAWSKGPPQTSAPSPRSQSPALPAQPQPHLTHSRRPSALGQAIPIKDGVSIPRNNVGAAAAKAGSPVTFGSIDDASASISSSPAAAPTIKDAIVKSFGTVPASNSNGKQLGSSRPSVSTASTSGSTSTSTPTSTAPAKPDKKDILKMFQSSSNSAPSPSETQSPSLRNAPLPSQNQPQTPSSQGSQFSPHFQTFVPGRSQPQNAGPNSGPSRSPVYTRSMPMPNGSAPRPPAPPNGPPSTGMPSPRLGPPHVAQPGPPAAPQGPPGQPHMPPQMMWNPSYYYGQEYSPYGGWGYVPPGMPPSAHPHPPHMPPPHMPPHPISPHNPPRNLQPSTPTLSNATPNPLHPPHPPPPLSHANSNMGNISSPPPTPSTRLNAGSSAFVPQQRPTSKIILKNPEGKEVALESLTKPTTSSTPVPAPSGQSSPYRGSSPGTPKRSSIRIESEEQRQKRLAEEENKEREKQRAKAAEEKAKKDKEDAARKAKEDAERKEQERINREAEENENERLRKEEEARLKLEQEERAKKEAELKEIQRKEEEERKLKEEEEAAAARKAAEEERLRKEEERKKEEEEALKAKELEDQRKDKEEKKRKEDESKAAEIELSRQKTLNSAPEEGEILEPGASRVLEPGASKEAKEMVKEPLSITTTTSNTADLGKKRPANLNIQIAKNTPVASALSTARSLESLNSVKYPEGIQSPKPELNENAKPGRFRYDRDFLLQFKEVCKEKPPNLPPLDAIGLEPIDPSALAMARGGSNSRRNAAPSRQSSVPFGTPSQLGKSGGGFSMGNFTTPGGHRMSSEDRFAISSAGNRSASVGGPGGIPFVGGRPAAMQRTASQGGQIRERTRSKRGEKRPPADGGRGGQYDRNASAQQNMLEPVAPLQVSENRWDRKSLAMDHESPEMVDRKVKGLLNKLTMEKFDSISDQIITWANKSEKEKDGRTLIQVIRLVFEKATDEATWSEMYARLCRKMMEQISPLVQDDGIKNNEGKPIAGGQLFRKYLLNRCQEDFERGWVAKEATAAAAAVKAASDEAVKAANSTKKEDEIALYSDEYYAAQKAKRQGLGLIKFIGELFKLQMLTERIMHECVKKLLGNVENPEEEEIESLCKLLTTVGGLLDTPKAHAHMDIYFSRMKELTKSPNVSSRMQFMLQDVIELRLRKWITRNTVAAPTTLAQVHEIAAKEKATLEKEALNKQSNMSRTSSNRGQRRGTEMEQGPDGWAVAGSTRPVSKAGDLSNFGKISKGQPMTFGPSSVFSNKAKVDTKRDSISRSSSSSNMFSMLSQGAEPEQQKHVERKKLVLQPRTVPKADDANDATPEQQADSDSSSEEEEKAVPEMSASEAAKKIDEDIKELFAVRNIDEAEVYFTALPLKFHHTLVDKVVNKAVESKAADSDLVATFFERASSKQLCSAAAFEEGFLPIAEFLDDIAIDAPHAFKHFANMVKGAKLDSDAQGRIAEKSGDGSEKLLALLS